MTAVGHIRNKQANQELAPAVRVGLLIHPPHVRVNCMFRNADSGRDTPLIEAVEEPLGNLKLPVRESHLFGQGLPYGRRQQFRPIAWGRDRDSTMCLVVSVGLPPHGCLFYARLPWWTVIMEDRNDEGVYRSIG